MPATERHVYEFGPWRLDTALRQLTRAGQPAPLAATTFDLLLALIEAHPQALSRRALDGRVRYDGNSIDEHLLWLAAMLGDGIDGKPLVEALPRRGWRLAVEDLRRETQASERDSTLTERFAAGLAAAPALSSGGSPAAARRGGFRPGGVYGRYEVLALIGSGGMGKVYLARDARLERKVALKLLSGRMTRNQEWLRRFEREARAIGALNHPNILTVHEVGEIDGHHYIATEYVEGRTLRAALKDGPLAPLQALAIATQVAGALAAAHAAGIVHRDLKPENLMLRGDGWVKLLDFGLAKPLNWRSLEKSRVDTLPGVIMGTANYMSPEQARGQPVDARSDVFSTGVLLYEMLTGSSPFAGPTTSDVIAAVLERQPLPLAQRLPDAPVEIDRILARCLRKDRSQRYAQAGELEQELKALRQELELRARFGDSLPPASADTPSLPARHTLPPPGARQGEAAQLDSFAAHEIPEVRYAQSGEVNIAWQAIGEGPIDLVFVMGWVSHLESFWAEPHFARFLRRLASFSRVILFDKRGTGLSDRVPLDQLPTLEQRMDDVRAVMEAAGSERAVLCGVSEGGPMCSLFAATYPERTVALVMMGSYARRLRCEDYPWGPDEAGRDAFLELIRREWGGPVGIEVRAPSLANDPAFRAWWAGYLRRGASPAAAVALTRMNSEIDIRAVLPSVRVPTLVIHRSGDACLRVQEGRYLAEHIPGAKFVELPGDDHLPFVGAQDEFLDEIEEFLTGVRHASGFDRVLATVLVARTGGDGSAPAQVRLEQHQSFLRKEIELFKGRLIEIDADHALASFDGPARAIRAACAIRAFAQRLAVPLQAGLHTGECDVIGERMGGVAVEIAREVAAAAAVGEVLVSSTVKDLVAGSGLLFDERGLRGLPGTLGDWRVYAVGR